MRMPAPTGKRHHTLRLYLLFVVGHDNSCNNNGHHCCLLYQQTNKRETVTKIVTQTILDLPKAPPNAPGIKPRSKENARVPGKCM